MPLTLFPIELFSESLLLICSILVLAAVLVTTLGSRWGVPSLLLFILLGMAVGQDGLGLKIDDYEVAESFGHFAMTIILFTAGFETSLSETKPVFRKGIILSSLGVFLTVILTGLFVWIAFGDRWGIPILICFLMAAILSSTDSTSVFSVLKSKKLRLREHLAPMIELESGSNDPMAYTLTIVLVKLLTTKGLFENGGGTVALTVGLVLFIQIAVGLIVGLGVGHAAKWLMAKINLPSFAITSILLLSIGMFANGLASLFSGNGLLAIYVTALIIGNHVKLKQPREVSHFFDGLTWLMQLAMFLVLGLLARPSHMLPMLLPALLIGSFLLFVARPLSVFACLLPFRGLSGRAKFLTSWVGLKGAGPILFALCPVVAGIEHASEIFNIVVLITLFSLLVQGGSIGKMAGWLNLSYAEDPKAEVFGMEIPEEMGMLRDHIVSADDLVGGSTLRDLHLPHGIRVMMVKRGEKFLVPHGSMALEEGDKLIIIMGDSDD